MGEESQTGCKSQTGQGSLDWEGKLDWAGIVKVRLGAHSQTGREKSGSYEIV